MLARVVSQPPVKLLLAPNIGAKCAAIHGRRFATERSKIVGDQSPARCRTDFVTEIVILVQIRRKSSVSP